MKHFLILLTILFCTIVHAETFNQYWYVENNTPIQTTCETGGDITLPTAPTKYGYDFMGWGTYVPIEYLESTGTQWINTGVVPDSAIRVQTRVFTSVNTSARWNTILGSNMKDSTGAENFTVAIYIYSGGHNFYMGYIGDHNTGVPAEYDTWYNIEAESTLTEQYLKIDDLIIYSQHAKRYPQTTSPIALFGCYSKDNGITWIPPIKIGNTKIWRNNTLVRDFIPVLAPDGTPCMFDKVEGKFYYNAGTGQFIAGPVLTE